MLNRICCAHSIDEILRQACLLRQSESYDADSFSLYIVDCVRIDVSTFLCFTRRSVVRLHDLAELHRNDSVDADAALDAASRTPVHGVVVRQWGVGEPA